jgi:hypothetical protein
MLYNSLHILVGKHMGKLLDKYFEHGDQTIIAKMSGISESNLWSWRNEKKTPKLSSVKWVLVAMSKFYGIREENLWIELSTYV